jgi:YfiH family protein
MSANSASELKAQLASAQLDWILPDWPAPPRVCAFATTRTGGVSAGPYATMNVGSSGRDDPRAIMENRRRLEAFLPSKPVGLNQVHGAKVATLPTSTPPGPADAAVTCEPGVVCSILIADCLPVAFSDRSGSVVGVAHAGWRGLAAGVIDTSVAALADLGARPNDVVAWLGPAIGPTAFEVGVDVYDVFCDADPGARACFVPHRDGKWLADLYGLARRSLARAGVTSVHGGGYCTHSDAARFFSYRRERDSGRMAAVAWLAR